MELLYQLEFWLGVLTPFTIFGVSIFACVIVGIINGDFE